MTDAPPQNVSQDASQDAPPSIGAPDKPGYRIYVLTILVLVYTFNFLDRQIIGILAIPIKEDLNLSDSQLGLLGGIAFAVLYSTLGVPIAWLADRVSRTWIMTGALTVWSIMTAACGFVGNFWQLFAARVGVGIGEAGGVAPAYSIIADYYPPHKRARALAIYSFGIPIGSAIGIVFGGIIASMLDWRIAFIIVGAAGVLLAPLFRLTVREPARGRFDPPQAETKPVSIGKVLRVLSRKPSFWFLTFGASASSMMGYGVFFWLPSFFVRSFQIDLLEASLLFGAILLVAGLIGIWMGGLIGDRLGQKNKGAYAYVPAAAFLLTAPFYAAGVLAPSPYIAVALFFVPVALGLAWLGPTLSAFQHLVAPNMRATASSIFLLINNLLGIGGGVYVLGKLSDTLRPYVGDESLRYSILAGSSFYLVAALLFYFASRHLARDWEG